MYFISFIVFYKVEEFKRITLEEVHKDINYYKKAGIEDMKRETERMEIYKDVLRDMNLL